MENGSFEDVFPIGNGDIPASYVSSPEGIQSMSLKTGGGRDQWGAYGAKFLRKSNSQCGGGGVGGFSRWWFPVAQGVPRSKCPVKRCHIFSREILTWVCFENVSPSSIGGLGTLFQNEYSTTWKDMPQCTQSKSSQFSWDNENLLDNQLFLGMASL